jgi:hypothetical protein
MTTTAAHITWVRIGAGRVAHILGEYGTAARSTSKCGKAGKVTISGESVGQRPVCDRCLNIRRSA